MLRIDVSWSQWQSGLSQPLLVDTIIPLPHLECRWLKSLRTFLSFTNSTLELDSSYVQAPKRVGDFHIIDFALQSGLFDHEAITIINYCHLFLHVTTVSELFNSEGAHILPEMFDCRASPWRNPDTIIALQQRPSDYQIKWKWQRLCRQWCKADGSIVNSISLREWTTPSHLLRLRRRSYLEESAYTTLYHWQDGCYWECLPEPSSQSFSPNRPTTWTPTSTAIPVDIYILDDSFITRPERPWRMLPSPPRNHFQYHFYDYVKTLSQWERHLLEHVESTTTPEHLMHFLQSDDALQTKMLLVSDGSDKDGAMSFGWFLGTQSNQPLARNQGPGFGLPSSHRAEAWGMLSGGCFLHHLQVYTHIDLPPALVVETISDNAGLIKRTTSRQTYTTVFANATLAADWDLTEQIHTTYQTLHLPNHTYQWVKGHQDDNTPYARLPIAAKYNVQADKLAEAFMIANPQPRLQSPLLPAAKCTLLINNVPHQGHYSRAIRHAASLPVLYTHLCKTHAWSQSTCDDVNWNIFQTAANNYHTTDNHLLKLVHDQLPTGKHKSKSAKWVPSTCRLCDRPETFDHLMQCQRPILSALRTSLPAAIQHHCAKHNAPRNFTKIVTTAIRDWLHVRPILGEAEIPPRLATAVLHQHKIGWHLFAKGFHTTQWELFLADKICRPTAAPTTLNPSQFLTSLTKIIWKGMSDFWTSYLSVIHKKDKPGHSPAKILEYQAHIRHLHTRRGETLAIHRESYFHSDVEDWLRFATGGQMKTYLLNYEPAIYISIKQAHNASTLASVLRFAGFHRIVPSLAHRIPARPAPANNKEPTHRKHVRKRSTQAVVDRFRSFFKPSTVP